MIKVLTKREKIIFLATISVIVFAAAFNFLIVPLLTRNADLNRQIASSRIKLEKYSRLLSSKDYIKNKFSRFASALVEPGKEGPQVTALSELENIAKEADIRIIDVRPQGQAAKGRFLYKESLIDLRLEGAMEGYLKFIYNLENSLTLLKIKKFQLTAKPNTGMLEGAFTVSQPALE